MPAKHGPRGGPRTLPLRKKPVAVPRWVWNGVSQQESREKHWDEPYRWKILSEDSLTGDMEECARKARQYTHNHERRHIFCQCRAYREKEKTSNTKIVCKSSSEYLHRDQLQPCACYPIRKKLTEAIGLQINDERPITNSDPPVDKLTASVVVFRSFAISEATLRRDVDENVAQSVTQLSTKTIKQRLQNGILLSMPDRAVWLFSNVLRFVVGSTLPFGVDGDAETNEIDLSSSILWSLDDFSSSMMKGTVMIL
jgi:hypothetical protein